MNKSIIGNIITANDKNIRKPEKPYNNSKSRITASAALLTGGFINKIIRYGGASAAFSHGTNILNTYDGGVTAENLGSMARAASLTGEFINITRYNITRYGRASAAFSCGTNILNTYDDGVTTKNRGSMARAASSNGDGDEPDYDGYSSPWGI